MNDVLLREVRPVPLGGQVPGGRGAVQGSRPLDILIRDRQITAVGAGLDRPAGIPELHGGGRWALPGLWDQHVHVVQWSLVRSRLDLSAATGVESAVDLVRAGLAADPHGDGPLVGYGHRSATWARQPTAEDLDEVSPQRPVVLISGDAHHGWLNSAGQRLLGVPVRQEVVWENEWFDAYDRLGGLPGAAEQSEAAVLEAVREARSRGVVGLVDLEFSPSWDRWPGRLAALGPFRVRTSAYAGRLPDIIERGWRTGTDLPGTDGWAQMGPLKLISDGSLNTRTAWCCEPYAGSADLDEPRGAANFTEAELTELVATAHAHGLETALHAIGDRAVSQALEVFARTGAAGSIEHVQLVPRDGLELWAGLPVRASVQPAHLLDDRSVTERVWPDRTQRAFAFGALREHGIPLVLGSDAPVAPLDPWLSMAVAVFRASEGGDPWHPELSLTPREALAASVDGRRLAVGEPGDVVLLDDDPLAGGDPGAGPEEGATSDPAQQARVLRTMGVSATVIGGHLVHGG
ncbi:MAG TPA: amidohydrolase family protein [Ornithinicoccus sp.]|nr:amidohydrolase family protein [Ornithinicoccus sp.]